MANILLLEDDESLNRGISLKLQKEGYQVFSAFGVTEAKQIFGSQKIDLIISDITMKDGNGLEFAGWVRKTSDVHLLFLTALNQEVDIVNGYDVGADDYITKPFSLLVLISKVHALMRRIDQSSGGTAEKEQEICSGNIRVQRAQMKVYHGEEELNLSKKELQLLCYFLEHSGQIISKEQILEAVWDIDGQFVDDNTVPVTISRLKKRLADSESSESKNEAEKDDTEYIKNVRGLDIYGQWKFGRSDTKERTGVHLAGTEIKKKSCRNDSVRDGMFSFLIYIGNFVRSRRTKRRFLDLVFQYFCVGTNRKCTVAVFFLPEGIQRSSVSSSVSGSI